MSRKPRSDSRLKNLSEEDQEALWRVLTQPRNPDGDDPKDAYPLTLDETVEELPGMFGISSSRTALAEWRSWYDLKRRMENAQSRADQVKLEWLSENPDTNPDALEKLGQFIFTSEAVESRDIGAFVALLKVMNQRKILENDTRRIDLLEKKAVLYDEVKKAAENKTGGITAEEMAEIERKLKMM